MQGANHSSSPHRIPAQSGSPQRGQSPGSDVRTTLSGQHLAHVQNLVRSLQQNGSDVTANSVAMQRAAELRPPSVSSHQHTPNNSSSLDQPQTPVSTPTSNSTPSTSSTPSMSTVQTPPLSSQPTHSVPQSQSGSPTSEPIRMEHPSSHQSSEANKTTLHSTLTNPSHSLSQPCRTPTATTTISSKVTSCSRVVESQTTKLSSASVTTSCNVSSAAAVSCDSAKDLTQANVTSAVVSQGINTCRHPKLQVRAPVAPTMAFSPHSAPLQRPHDVTTRVSPTSDVMRPLSYAIRTPQIFGNPRHKAAARILHKARMLRVRSTANQKNKMTSLNDDVIVVSAQFPSALQRTSHNRRAGNFPSPGSDNSFGSCFPPHPVTSVHHLLAPASRASLSDADKDSSYSPSPTRSSDASPGSQADLMENSFSADDSGVNSDGSKNAEPLQPDSRRRLKRPHAPATDEAMTSCVSSVATVAGVERLQLGDVVWGRSHGIDSWPGRLVSEDDVKSTSKQGIQPQNGKVRTQTSFI